MAGWKAVWVSVQRAAAFRHLARLLVSVVIVAVSVTGFVLPASASASASTASLFKLITRYPEPGWTLTTLNVSSTMQGLNEAVTGLNPTANVAVSIWRVPAKNQTLVINLVKYPTAQSSFILTRLIDLVQVCSFYKDTGKGVPSPSVTLSNAYVGDCTGTTTVSVIFVDRGQYVATVIGVGMTQTQLAPVATSEAALLPSSGIDILGLRVSLVELVVGAVIVLLSVGAILRAKLVRPRVGYASPFGVPGYGNPPPTTYVPPPGVSLPPSAQAQSTSRGFDPLPPLRAVLPPGQSASNVTPSGEPNGRPGAAPGPLAAVPSMPGGWYPDPHGRHGFRFWSGKWWTDHVHSNGVSGTDPVPGATAPPPVQAGSPGTGPAG
jgi:hypothetical protein